MQKKGNIYIHIYTYMKMFSDENKQFQRRILFVGDLFLNLSIFYSGRFIYNIYIYIYILN